MTHDTQELVAEAINEWFGPRCEMKDTDELPELHGQAEGRCPACLAWEQYDAITAQAEEIRALRERNAQMEAALREVIDHCANTGRGNALVNDRIYERVEETARAALAGKG